MVAFQECLRRTYGKGELEDSSINIFLSLFQDNRVSNC